MLFCRAVYSVRWQVCVQQQLWCYSLHSSLPSFMALTAQNRSCHIWVSLRMTLVFLIYLQTITFEDKLEIAICNARGLGAPAMAMSLFLSLSTIHEHIFHSHIHACFPHDCHCSFAKLLLPILLKTPTKK